MITNLRYQVSITIAFEFIEPLIGPYGWRGEQVAVDKVRVLYGLSRGAYKVEGKGRNIRKDGTIGERAAIAYDLDWDHLPEEVQDQVNRSYWEARNALP